MENIGFINLLQALYQGRIASVGSGATSTSIPVNGMTLVPSAWKGGYVYFIDGINQGVFASITDNTANTLTVSNLTNAPNWGDTFLLFLGPQVNVSVSAPENVYQWGGVAVTGRDISLDLARLDIALSALRDALLQPFQPVSIYNSSTGAALTVMLDTGLYGGRTIVEVWVSSSAAATFTVAGSRDGTNWRTVDTISLSAAGEAARGYQNAYRYIQVSTTAANNNQVEIVASR